MENYPMIPVRSLFLYMVTKFLPRNVLTTSIFAAHQIQPSSIIQLPSVAVWSLSLAAGVLPFGRLTSVNPPATRSHAACKKERGYVGVEATNFGQDLKPVMVNTSWSSSALLTISPSELGKWFDYLIMVINGNCLHFWLNLSGLITID